MTAILEFLAMLWAQALKAATWALAHWQELAVAALIAAACIQTLRLEHAKSDIAAARAALIDPATKKTWQTEATQARSDLGICRASALSLNASIAAQNAALDQLSAESAAKVSQAEAALSAAQRGRSSAEARAARLIHTPAIGVDVCARAVAAREAVLGALQ